MKLIISFLPLFFQLDPYIGYKEFHLSNLNGSILDDKKKQEDLLGDVKQQRVCICTGPYAYACHKAGEIEKHCLIKMQWREKLKQ